MSSTLTISNENSFGKNLLLFAVCLVGVLVLLFLRSFRPDFVVFSNDGPLGAAAQKAIQPPTSFFGMWTDLNWVGANGGSYPAGITGGMFWLLGPLYFSKFYAPLTLLFLGFSACFFFRHLNLSPAACLLAGLATTLNSDFFSAACWGVVTHPVTFAVNYLALAALADNSSRLQWVRVALAGLAVGIGVTEGADIGAIFSLHVAAFAIYQALISDGPVARKVSKGVARVALVAVFAAFIAAQSLTSLIGTQIKGVVGMSQDAETKARRWSEATQWSLPKVEVLQIIIPGVFGYRMDTPDGGQYWGAIGRQAGWEEHHQGLARYTGGGVYGGLVVVTVAIWALLQSFRKKESPFDFVQKRFIWFWGAMALLALLLAFGRYAPFYRLLYALPYFSTIRNPTKFMHVFHWALLVIFAYGVHGMWRCYIEAALTRTQNSPVKARTSSHEPKAGWIPATAFEKKWFWGSIIAVAASLLGYFIYNAARRDLEKYLQTVGFSDAAEAASIAAFSVREVGWCVLFLAVTLTILILIMRGRFAGERAKWAGILLGLVLVVDLGRANLPWIIYNNYVEKYASNPIVGFLREKPYEHRVTTPGFRLNQQFSFLQQLYQIEWMQHLFPYYNIQSLDIVQEPRVLEENATYRQTLSTNMVRLWELTNTRYLLGLAGGFVDALNQQLDPARQRFKQRIAFSLSQAPNGNTILAQTNDTGPFALLEFTGALPRAKLYANWQTVTNDTTVLQQLSSPEFDPARTVLVANEIAAPNPAQATNQSPGTVQFVSYAPKDIKLRAKADAPSVLLLNDKFDPNWKVWVDSQPAPLLRCNYLMRGVQVPAGEHTIEFRFLPPMTGLRISLAAIAVGLLLCGILIFSTRAAETPSAPKPEGGSKA